MIDQVIDRIRAEIMRLEGLDVFDQAGWERVLADLRAQDREHGLADAERRMRSAMGRQVIQVRTDLGMPGGDIQVTLVPMKGKGQIEVYREQRVVVETED